MTSLRSLCALLLFTSLPVIAGISPIRIEVERDIKLGNAPGRGNVPQARTQTWTLAIKLLNPTKDSFEDLTVHYWFFVRDIGGNDVRILKDGESKIILEKGARKTVETEPVTTKHTEAHTMVNQRRGAGAQTATRVPASGQKLVGCAVHVLNAGKVVSEYYSEASYKQLLGGTKPAPAAAKPAAGAAKPAPAAAKPAPPGAVPPK